MDRRQLFNFQTEKIEQAYVSSTICGANRVVVLADTSDGNAILFLKHFLTDHQIATLPEETTDLAPTLIFALQNEESFQKLVRRFFPKIAATLAEPIADREFFVLVLSDGDGSLAVHAIPD